MENKLTLKDRPDDLKIMVLFLKLLTTAGYNDVLSGHIDYNDTNYENYGYCNYNIPFTNGCDKTFTQGHNVNSIKLLEECQVFDSDVNGIFRIYFYWNDESIWKIIFNAVKNQNATKYFDYDSYNDMEYYSYISYSKEGITDFMKILNNILVMTFEVPDLFIIDI